MKWKSFPKNRPSKAGKYFIQDYIGEIQVDTWNEKFQCWSLFRPAAVVCFAELNMPVINQNTKKVRNETLSLHQDTEKVLMGIDSWYGKEKEIV